MPLNLFGIMNTFGTIIQFTIAIFLKKNLNHISDLFENNDKMKSWEDLRAKLRLDDNKKFHWRQIIYAIPRAWKKNVFKRW